MTPSDHAPRGTARGDSARWAIDSQLDHAVKTPNVRAYNRTVLFPERSLMMRLEATIRALEVRTFNC